MPKIKDSPGWYIGITEDEVPNINSAVWANADEVVAASYPNKNKGGKNMDKETQKKVDVYDHIAELEKENRRLNHAVNAFTLAMPIIAILGIAVGYIL